ncbi:MAG: S8 family serine peptidase [Bacteroidales bacterium]|nr:S8 family serine peptidase [Bacteroidales bacterium]
MNRRYLNGLVLGLAYIFFAQACVSEKLGDTTPVVSGVSQEQTDVPVGDPIAERVVTEVIVELDQETADLYADASADGLFAGIPGVTYERLFPDAGEWEERHRENGLHRFYKVTYEAGVKANTAVAVLGEIRGVAGVEVPVPKKICAIPYNDPYAKTYQWQYFNNGTIYNGFVSGADINVVPVWENYTAGTSNVIVSIVDQGIQMDHPDLKGVVLAGGANGSKNFTNNSYTITAGDHGCHVAGIVGGINNNGKGICGVAGGSNGTGGVTMMSCQIFGSSGGDSAGAIVWGADHGAVISQNSWGYNYDFNDDGQITGQELTYAMNAQASSSDKAAIDYFVKNAGCDTNGNQLSTSPMKGGVVIFAAGNDNLGNGAPGNYSGCIAVGSIGPDGRRAAYSNFGSWVDICAPGGEADRFPSSNGKSYILSCTSGSNYSFMCGTSMACPMVSGVAALVVSYFGGPGFTNTELKNMLLDNENRTIVPASDNIAGLVDAYAIFQANVNKNAAPEITTSYTGDFRVMVGESLSVDYTVTDADGDAFTVALDGDGSASLEKVNASTYRLVINGIAKNVGTHKATITATDERDGSSSVEVSYTIFSNDPPVISTTYTGNYKARVGETLVIDYKATDPDGDVCTFTFSGDASASMAKTGTNTCRVTVKTTAANVGTHKATLKASDGKGGEASVEITYVIMANNAPMIEALSTYPHDIPMGSDISVKYKATDPDGDAITFSLEGDGSALLFPGSDNTCTVAIQTSQRFLGEHNVTLVATDSTGEKTSEKLSYNIYINYPPVISTTYTGDWKVLVGNSLSVDFTITDANNDVLTVTYDNDGSSNMVKTSGVYRIILDVTAANAGTHNATLKADDGKGGVTEYPVRYTIINNHAPKVSVVGTYEKEIAVGQNLSATVKVEDEDGDELTVTLDGDATAQLVKGSNGEYAVKFLPTESTVGNHTATVKAVDTYGASHSASLTYKTYVNQAPVITFNYSGPTTLKWFETSSASFSAKDPEGKTPLKFSVVSDNAVSAPKVSGTSATVNVGDGKGTFHGTCTITATAEDVLGLKAEKTFTYTVLENRAPQLVKPVSNKVFQNTGERMNMDMTAIWQDPDGESMTFTFVSDNPEVAAVSNSGSTYFVKAGKTGAATITMTAKDGFGATVTETFKVGVYDDEQGPVVYPNPVIDFLTIRIGNEADVRIKIYSEMKKLVKEAEGTSSIFDPMKVDLSDLAPGRYTAKISYSGNTYEREIVKL